MNETEFRTHAKAAGYPEPEVRSQPPGRFIEKHAHADDLILLVTAGSITVDYGDAQASFGPGDMCEVKHGVPHTDAIGPEGASYALAWRAPDAVKTSR